MGFDTKAILEKTKQNFISGSKTIKMNFDDKKKNYSEKKASIKELDYTELKRLYEKRTGKKAEIVQKDFNTGKVIGKRAMTRGELELRVQFNKNVRKEDLSMKKKSMSKPKSKSKNKQSYTINFKI